MNGVSGKAHVCMVAYTHYATDSRVRLEAETLASHSYRVLCLTTKNGGEPERFTLDGVEVRELGVKKYTGKSAAVYITSYLRFLLSASAACLRLLVRGELDVVHVHNLPDFLVFAGLVPRLAGKKVVLDVHDSLPETFGAKFSNGSFVRRLLCLEEKVSALLAHKVICVNQPQRETLVGRGIPTQKTVISMNVPDPRLFGPTPGESLRPAEAGRLNLVYHGTMAQRLGVDLLIRAIPRVQERVPNVRLNLWGRGDDLATFQRLAETLGVQDAITFQSNGFPLEELAQQLTSMDIGVVGNRRTAAGDLMLPVKLLEYVAVGIPTVVPRLKAIQYYFSDEMVAYYEPEDVQSLSDAICRLHLDAERRGRQVTEARKFLATYGWERHSAELVTLYKQLVEN
jgi:glycosyltransferase involved in cell wall biosynthesis